MIVRISHSKDGVMELLVNGQSVKMPKRGTSLIIQMKTPAAVSMRIERPNVD